MRCGIHPRNIAPEWPQSQQRSLGRRFIEGILGPERVLGEISVPCQHFRGHCAEFLCGSGVLGLRAVCGSRSLGRTQSSPGPFHEVAPALARIATTLPLPQGCVVRCPIGKLMLPRAETLYSGFSGAWIAHGVRAQAKGCRGGSVAFCVGIGWRDLQWA